MNRPIKFRVWCKVTRHFTDSPYITASGGQLLWLHTGNQVSISNIDGGDYIIQQYTGFKDDKEVEIYEGDIVKWTEYQGWEDGRTFEGIYIVQWDDDGKWNLYDPHANDSLPMGNTKFDNVIGNIFENKELLK